MTLSAARRRKVFRWLRTAALALSGGFFAYYAYFHINEMPDIAWGVVQWSAMTLSVVLYVGSVGVVGSIWKVLLRDQVMTPSWWKIQSIFAISQFGKYLPGNVAQHVGRVYMAKVAGIPLPATIQSMAVEALLGVGVGASLALLSLWFVLHDGVLYSHVAIPPQTLGLLVITCLALPWFVIRGINILLPGLAHMVSGNGPIIEPRFRTMFTAVGLFLICFLINGTILNIQATFLFNQSDVSVLEYTVLFSVAWIAGYLVPGAPAGLGVREAIMVLLFSPIVGPAIAVGMSVSLRLTTSLGDVVAFFIGLLIGRILLGRS